MNSRATEVWTSLAQTLGRAIDASKETLTGALDASQKAATAHQEAFEGYLALLDRIEEACALVEWQGDWMQRLQETGRKLSEFDSLPESQRRDLCFRLLAILEECGQEDSAPWQYGEVAELLSSIIKPNLAGSEFDNLRCANIVLSNLGCPKSIIDELLWLPDGPRWILQWAEWLPLIKGRLDNPPGYLVTAVRGACRGEEKFRKPPPEVRRSGK